MSQQSFAPFLTKILIRNSAKQLLITYDTPAIAAQKAQYIDQNGLGGAMWWELDADKPRGQGSLVETVRMAWGQMEWKENELEYPGSSEYFVDLVK